MVGCIAGIVSIGWREKAVAAVSNGVLVFIVCGCLYTAPPWLPDDLLPLAYIIQSVSIALFMTWLLFNQQSVVCKLLEVKPLAYIGKISYGLYVYQGLFLTTGPNGKLPIQHFPLNLILTFICGVLSYEFMEKQVLKYKDRFGSSQPTTTLPIVQSKV